MRKGREKGQVMSASAANVMQVSATAKRYPMATMLGIAMLIGLAYDATWAIATGVRTYDQLRARGALPRRVRFRDRVHTLLRDDPGHRSRQGW